MLVVKVLSVVISEVKSANFISVFDSHGDNSFVLFLNFLTLLSSYDGFVISRNTRGTWGIFLY